MSDEGLKLDGPIVEGIGPDEAANVQYMHLALSLGYNELAKVGRTLGEKMFWRMLRDAATERLIASGGNKGESPFANEPEAIVINVPGPSMPSIRLLARDVELMRAYVAEHDARAVLLPGDTQVKP